MGNPLSKEKLDTELCKYCPLTEHGSTEVNTNPYNLCEGVCCEEAYSYYLDDFEGDKDELCC